MRPSQTSAPWVRFSGVVVAGLLLALLSSSPAAAAAPASVSGERRGSAEVVDHAGEPSEREALSAAAQTWDELAAASPDPDARSVTAYRGYLSHLRAYEADGDVVQLCSARSLIAGLAGDDEAELLAREDASLRLAEVDATLMKDRGDASACEPGTEGADETAGARVQAEAPGADLLPARTSTLPPLPQPIEGDAGTRGALTRGLRIGGAVGVGVGAALLGAMTYGLVVDARGGSELTELQPKADAGTLTAADWRRIDEINEEGRAGAQLAKVIAVAGGLAVVTGAALLIAGHRLERRRRSAVAITPRLGLGLGQASLTLRGRF